MTPLDVSGSISQLVATGHKFGDRVRVVAPQEDDPSVLQPARQPQKRLPGRPINHATRVAEQFAYYMKNRLTSVGVHPDDLESARMLVFELTGIRSADKYLYAHYNSLLRQLDGQTAVTECRIEERDAA